MGFIFSKSMNDSLKAQQEFMLMNSRLQTSDTYSSIYKRSAGKTTTDAEPDERETNGHADSLDTRISQIFWDFFGLTAVGLAAGAIKKKNPAVLLPIVPLSFVFAYQYDMGYGTLLQRMKGEAENILDTQSTLLELPKGPLTFEDLEKIRRSQSS